MHNEKSVIRHLIDYGADGYLLKSAGKEEILKAILVVNSGAKYFADDVMSSLIQSEVAPVVRSNEQLKQLTEREIEIIKLTANGLSSKQIGEKLFISPRTAETHRNNILKKLELKGIAVLLHPKLNKI